MARATCSLVLIAAGLGTTAPAPAAGQTAELHAISGPCEGETTHVLRSAETVDGASAFIRIVDGGDREVACIDASDHAAVSLQSRPGPGGEWLELHVDGERLAIFRLAEGTLEEIFVTPSAGPGEVYRDVTLLDLDGDDIVEVVRHRHDPIALPCGRDDLFIRPELFDAMSGTFRDAVIVPRARDESDVADVAVWPAAPVDRTAHDARVSVVSSSARVGGLPSRDRGVAELSDDDPTTAWYEGHNGDGVGAWLRIDAAAPLIGVGVDNGDGVTTGPVRWVIALGDGRLLRAVTPSSGRFAIRFDAPVQAGCIAMVAAGLPDGATSFAVGGVQPLTTLDVQAPHTALATIAADAAVQLDDVRLGATLALFGQVAADAPDAALAVFDEADASLQHALVRAMVTVDSEIIEAGLAARIGEARVDDEAARLWMARADTDHPDVRRALIARSDPADAISADAVQRLGPPRTADERAAALDGLAEAADDAVDIRIEALTRPLDAEADPEPGQLVVDALLVASNSGPDIRNRMLRVITRLVGDYGGPTAARQPNRDAVDAELLRSMLADDDGTTARFAIGIAGRAQVASLREAIRTIATNDPADELRIEALIALQALDEADDVLERFTRDSSPSVRLAAVTRLTVALSTDVLRERLAVETWPTIRVALSAAAAAHPELVLDVLRETDNEAEVVALLDALASRPDTIAAAAWLELAELWAGYPRVVRRLVERADGCDDPALRSWLDTLASSAVASDLTTGANVTDAADRAAPTRDAYDVVHRAALRTVTACDVTP